MEDEADNGPGRGAPSRLCIATRQVRPVSDLIRFVAGPDGALVPDIRNRLPGRGVWVTADSAVLAEAIRRKAFARGLKTTVLTPTSLVEDVGRLLARDALQMLSLANKAGAVTTGFAKIEGMRPPLLALVQASDGSEAEVLRLQAQCRGKGRHRRDPAIVRAFTSEELALSIGRELVIHAALAVHDAASVFLERALRYVEFLSGGPAKRDEASANGPAGVSGFPLPGATGPSTGIDTGNEGAGPDL